MCLIGVPMQNAGRIELATALLSLQALALGLRLEYRVPDKRKAPAMQVADHQLGPAKSYEP